MPFSEDLVRGSLVPVTLAMLDERPMYGYEMVKLVNARTNGLLELKEGTLYPALHRMEADDLISSDWRDTEGTERKRKYYSITRKGKKELTRRAEEMRQFTSTMATLLHSA